MMTSKQTGDIAEKIAAHYLSKKGYRILQTNYRNSIGEIDIVARHGHTLVFVEVRSKTGTSFGLPLESINRAKSTRLIKVAEGYLNEYPASPEDWRIDVIGIVFEQPRQVESITHIPGAVERPDGF
ncbi:MAG: YraN family protein [Dehalococcoidales bacterium]|jgi:putative endonuclease|nr:YraN family protein [Dehalococcoidales bacterium]MDD3264313.1 YraN family protein [Dehalococcoidales bacterium]MDD4322066.1 YraN family protein [Dehalococcoidales bacterium]MDD4793637.1 YraN family protein [Dehalococcoidales bacterium]MDD5122820.1 YraN family protein [Dehalococcoidales bacterium]